MRKSSEFQIKAQPLFHVIRKEIDERHKSLSEIASLSGLSVPTIARIYSNKVETVQAKTARRVGEALGYIVEVPSKGELKLIPMPERPNKGKLTKTQKTKILKAIERILDEF